MNTNLVNKVGEIGQDNLIAKLSPAAETMGIKVAAGAGDLKRGTLLGVNASGKCVVYSGSTGEDASAVNCILADDVDATGESDVTAVAYRSGNFNPNAIIVGTGYTLTDADIDALRKYDIIFTQML